MKVKGNLDLSKNQIKVVSIERLASDPTGGDLFEGRIWLNTVSDTVKIRTEVGTVVVGTASGLAALQSELDTTQAGAGLAVTGAYNPPGGSVFLGSTTSIVDALLALDIEVDANGTAISSETSNRISADNAIQSELDVTQTGAGLNSSGTYTIPAGQNYLTGNTSIKQSISSLDGQCKINEDAITVNSDAVTAEEAARISADLLKLSLTGGTLTGNITMVGGAKIIQATSPTSTSDLVNKAYADSLAAGFRTKDACRVATTTSLPSNTYSTLVITATAPSAFPSIDSINLDVADRILVKNEGTATNNGIYTLTTAGANPVTGVAEISTVDTAGVGAASITTGDYFAVYAPAGTFWVWMNKDAGGGAPTPGGGETLIEVTVTTGDSDQVVSNSIVSAVDANGNFGATNVSGTSTVVTITNAATGSVTDIHEGTAATGFSLATIQQGVTSSAGTAWAITRSIDFDGSPSNEISGGSQTYIQLGATNSSSTWAVVWDGDVVIDTDDVIWTQTAGAGAYAGIQTELDNTQAGTGLDTSGNYVIPVGSNYIDTAISVHSATVLLDTQLGTTASNVSTNAGNISSLTTLANTHETAIGLAGAGTFTSPSGTNFIDTSVSVMDAINKLDTELADGTTAKVFHWSSSGTATSHPITHNLGFKYANITVIDAADDNQIIPDSVVFDSTTQLTVTLATALNIHVVIVV